MAVESKSQLHASPANVNKELERLRSAADGGDAESLFTLGSMYFSGEGVPQDDTLAFSLWRKAAEQNHANSLNNLTFFYFEGRGAPKSEKMAFSCSRRSANLGNAIGQLNLGRMYLKGSGVKKDIRLAKMWLTKAAQQGESDAQATLDALKNTIAPWKMSAVVGAIVATGPWAYFYIVYLAPRVNHFLGLDTQERIHIGAWVIPIMAPVLAVMAILLPRPKK